MASNTTLKSTNKLLTSEKFVSIVTSDEAYLLSSKGLFLRVKNKSTLSRPPPNRQQDEL